MAAHASPALPPAAMPDAATALPPWPAASAQQINPMALAAFSAMQQQTPQQGAMPQTQVVAAQEQLRQQQAMLAALQQQQALLRQRAMMMQQQQMMGQVPNGLGGQAPQPPPS